MNSTGVAALGARWTARRQWRRMAMMKQSVAVLVLVVAAVLEAGGDAVVRTGLHATGSLRRAGLLCAGGAVLFAYGVVVNAPAWDFGRLLGLYVVFFFIVAQVISWLFFHQPPSS